MRAEVLDCLLIFRLKAVHEAAHARKLIQVVRMWLVEMDIFKTCTWRTKCLGRCPSVLDQLGSLTSITVLSPLAPMGVEGRLHIVFDHDPLCRTSTRVSKVMNGVKDGLAERWRDTRTMRSRR